MLVILLFIEDETMCRRARKISHESTSRTSHVHFVVGVTLKVI